jgi:fatty acid desaturase/predicted heme/steroid binding protein
MDIPWEELAKHNRAGDAWVAVRGHVYDVSAWASAHPGGSEPVLLNAGRDATALFESYHLFGEAKADQALARLPLVGKLATHEFPPFRSYRGRFYSEVRRRVREHFGGRRPGTPWPLVGMSLGLFALLIGAYYAALAALAALGSFAVAAVLATVAGWAAAMVSLIPVHEGSHCSLGTNPWGWRLLGAMHDVGNGCSFYNWLHQHFLGHHPYTNIEDVDPDVMTNDPDIRRIKSSQKYHAYYRLQALYAPILYGLLAVKFRLNDLTIFYSSHSNGVIRLNPPDLWHTTMFLGGKLVWLLHRILLPLYLLGFDHLGSVLLLATIVDLVSSYYLALAFQISHVVPQAKWPRPEGGAFDEDWGETQVRTTIDYAHDSPWTTFLTGGLNYQAVHHLFPGVSQAFYPQIGALVRDTCAKFGVQYVIVPTFTEALGYHFAYLKQMGSTPSSS